jgi:hypothetical protein
VAVYAAGGQRALEQLQHRAGERGAQRLLAEMKRT